MLLNVGPTRADNVTGVQKIEHPTGSVLPDVVKSVLYVILLLFSFFFAPFGVFILDFDGVVALELLLKKGLLIYFI